MCKILLNKTEKFTEKDAETKRKMLCKLLVVICVSIIPYIFTLHGDFVFDDSEAIVKNSDVTANYSTDLFYNDFWGANIQSNFSHKSYRPLAILSFRFNHFLSGNYLDPYHFKITNLVIHTICCVLLWFLYQAILRGVGYNPLNGDIDIAFWSTLVFGVHPVHDEAICGIVGRADLLAACTFFTSFLLYYRGCRCKGLVSWLFIAAAVCTAGVSMLFKENGVTVLGFCFMYELTKLNNRSKHGVSVVRLFLLISSSVALLSTRWLLMVGTKPEFKPIDNPAAFSDSQFTKLLTYHYIYLLNILLLIWPQWLCFDWSMGCVPLIENTLDRRIVGLLLLYMYALMCAFFLLNRRNFGITKRAYLAALSLTAIPFLPASNIFFPVGFVIAERILYISSAGYCLFLILGLHKILSISKGHFRTMIISLFYFLLLVYGTRSWQRSYQWQSEYRLFTSGLAVCPLNAKVHYNVAKVADAHNHTEWALAEYREAIRLYPEYYQAMNNLANLLKNEKQYPAAEYYLKAAIGLKKDFPAAWMNLGIVLANTRRHKESEVAYETALRYRVIYPDCYYNLGNLYLEMNRTDEAMRAWQHAIQLNSKHALAWSNLLALLDNSGQMEEADRMIPGALLELPESPSINFVIANIYGKMERYYEAEKYFKKAIELFGSRVQAVHFANLGVLYHRWRKYKLAEGMYLEALKVDPMFKSAQKNLIAVRKNIK